MSESATLTRTAKQVGALPWRLNCDGELEVLLVTSRVSRHLLIPKGWPVPGKNNRQSAVQEVFEEAGVRGRASKKPLGKFIYDKVDLDGSTPCVVSVFSVSKVEELEDWPERDQRARR